VKLDKLEKRVGNIDGPMEDTAAVAQAMADADVQPSGHEASLGTIGGGNHFAEFQQVDTVHAPEALAALGHRQAAPAAVGAQWLARLG
jgi:release factor H-coupled RctB family protein